MTATPLVAVRWLRRGLVAGLAGYLGWLAVDSASAGTRFRPERDLWLVTALLVLAVALTAARALLVAQDRLAWACLAGGSACWTAGNLYFLLVVRTQDPMPFPSWADAGYLSFYPLVWCGLILLLRQQSRSTSAGMWMDGLVGALAAAAATSALLLGPILAATGGSVTTVATNLSYPVADLLLLAVLAGGYALFGWHPAKASLLLGGGLAAFAVTDTSYLFRTATDTYTTGTSWDAGWAIGLVLVALAAWQPAAASPRQARPATKPALVGPLLCSMVGLGLLVDGALTRLPVAAVGLAAGCVLAALLRTLLTFREVQNLAQARHEARTDDLTGLANRREFTAGLARATSGSAPAHRVAVLLMDLDRFKQVNSSFGHRVGDALLRLAAVRLTQTVRSGDLLARLGADEFGVLLCGAADDQEATGAAKRCRDVLQSPYAIDGLTLHLHASVGIARHPEHGSTGELLLRHAETARSQAKRSGTGLQTYSAERDTHFSDRLALTEALRTALYADQLVVHYQPMLTLSTNRVAAVEALVRWQHPDRGLIFPDEFLPLAEAAGLMPALTTVVLDSALRQCAAWRAAGRDLSVAVNLSPSDLLDPELPALIEALLGNLGLPSSSLHLEITETIIMRDPERSLAVLRRLDALGLRLAIDDYGSGYSSLTYLSTLPVSELKIDRSFVMAMAGSGPPAERARAIVKSTVVLADALGLDLIAEGVETPETLAQLRHLRCTTAQGYYLSRPLPAADLDRWLDRQSGGTPETAQMVRTGGRRTPAAGTVRPAP